MCHETEETTYWPGGLHAGEPPGKPAGGDRTARKAGFRAADAAPVQEDVQQEVPEVGLS